MAYAIMRIQKHKSCGSLAAAERHGKNRSRLKHLSYPNRSKENMVYKKHRDLSLVQSWKREVAENNIKPRKNSVLAYEIVLTASPEAMPQIEKNIVAWRNANMRWLKSEFSKDNILQMRLEFDESSIHIHAFIIPRIDNRLCAREFTGNKYKLSKMQSSYAKAMDELNIGLERGKCYLGDEKKDKPRHKTLKDYYREIESERAIKTVAVRVHNNEI